MFVVSTLFTFLLVVASSAYAAPDDAQGSRYLRTRGETYTDGVATFFTQNGVAGACGQVHQDTDLIAAIDQERYGNSGEKSKLCGKKVKITNTKNKKTVTVVIADDCPTCNNGDSIDLSVGAFTKIATKEEGMVPISWNFVD